MYKLTRHIDRRRAVLAVLLAAKPAALSLGEIAARLRNDGVEAPSGAQALSDLLRNQVRNGNVVKRGRARFAAGYFSRSGEWRARNWRLLAERTATERPAQRVPVKYS